MKQIIIHLGTFTECPDDADGLLQCFLTPCQNAVKYIFRLPYSLCSAGNLGSAKYMTQGRHLEGEVASEVSGKKWDNWIF